MWGLLLLLLGLLVLRCLLLTRLVLRSLRLIGSEESREET